MNPITILDGILEDYASPRTRRLIHALIALAGVVGTAFLAANGDWKVAALTLFGTIYASANKANTSPVPVDPPEAVGTVVGLPDPGPIEDESGEDESLLYGDGAERG